MIKPKRKIFFSIVFMGMFLFFSNLLLLEATADLYRELNLEQARIFDYQGLVEVFRDGKAVKVKKDAALKKGDEIIVYYDSYLELYFKEKKDNIIRIEGENSFVLEEVFKLTPYGFEVRYDPAKKRTQTVLIFNEKSWSERYVELLQKGKIPYTVVFVREGIVAAESIDVENPRQVLLRQGQMTYIFKGKDPFAAMPWEEYIDMCIEDCWEEW
ncbi:MAG: hypothetical protein NC936_03010 [Candidatus Omnitrophica bacterium]|nr:hypothetical protein [Candidatus Omnitrophota bacterium]